ncbi:MAG: DUF433 domain-containing protein [Planctomycetaceae bacterium]
MTATVWLFVELDQEGVAYIEGTTTKVIEIALDHTLRRLSADEIQAAYPYLSLPQIHAALGYYYDHLGECERQIDERRQRAEDVLERVENSALQERLRQRKAGA